MFIDRTAYDRACDKARDLVDRATLREAIIRVYELWFADKVKGNPITFHAYFGLSLLDLGIEDMFETEQYRKAIAAYFQPRALRKIRSLRTQAKPETARANNRVEFASAQRVRIRIDPSVSLVFKATKKTGQLKWIHVVDAYKAIHFGTGQLSDEASHQARRQALQVLNNVRARRAT